MTSSELENLGRVGKLKREVATQAEFAGLVRSARARLKDAHDPSLALESRFDLAYNASHALASAALRWHGFRSDSRYMVFQALPHTVGLGPEVWRVLDKCHGPRNMSEYEGYAEIDRRLLEDLMTAAERLETAVCALGPIRHPQPNEVRSQGPS
ncbi:MAG: hypothetical protein M1325_01145 [Actinobacteria bacterium]|nr:hypothetical protein [Actinomycetota bacterium]